MFMSSKEEYLYLNDYVNQNNYIDTNTKLRSEAATKLDGNFYKLLNNSLYGKTVENLRKRINLRLCNNATRLMTYTSKVSFRKSIKIDNDLVAVLLNKETICLNRPSYIGQTVLDLSKLRMYKLKYDELKKYEDQFNCKLNIIAGDTDSFFLECLNVSVRNQLIPAMIADELLETSNYDEEHTLFSSKNAFVVGKFKDETKGAVELLEGVFLRPKCYSVLTNVPEKHILRAKGITLGGSGINHESYLQTYKENTVISVPQSKIRSLNHQLFTNKNVKKALSAVDDKRFWVTTNKSVAYGHYSLR